MKEVATIDRKHGSGAAPLLRQASGRKLRSGFTLVEISLAIIVVVVGVLALFSLITSGLDSSARAAADTQSALFASDVFAGLRSRSLRCAEEGADSWGDFWRLFGLGQTNIPVSVQLAWGDNWKEDPMKVQVGHHTNVYTNWSFRTHLTTNVINHSLRYTLRTDSVVITNTVSNVVERGGDALPFTQTNRLIMATLRVWDGRFGTTNESDAIIYYSEFNNPGDL